LPKKHPMVATRCAPGKIPRPCTLVSRSEMLVKVHGHSAFRNFHGCLTMLWLTPSGSGTFIWQCIVIYSRVLLPFIFRTVLIKAPRLGRMGSNEMQKAPNGARAVLVKYPILAPASMNTAWVESAPQEGAVATDAKWNLLFAYLWIMVMFSTNEAAYIFFQIKKSFPSSRVTRAKALQSLDSASLAAEEAKVQACLHPSSQKVEEEACYSYSYSCLAMRWDGGQCWIGWGQISLLLGITAVIYGLR
jgi:hypothetical protein